MKNWFKVFFLLFILGLLVYFNSLNNKFLIDDYAFLNNPVLSGTKFILSQWDPYREQAWGVMDSEENLGYYRPMAHMVLDFCYAAFKNNLWQYHLLNLFLLILASSLIYLFIERITGNFNLALLTGLFYLIHPINGIIVNYISASVFAFQVIFALGTILLLLESLERTNNRALYALSLVFFFISLFWHESGMMIPFYISAFILLFRKDPFKEKIFYLSPYFLIILFYIVFRSFVFSRDVNLLQQTAIFHMTGWEYLASLFKVIAWYIGKLFYPQGIVMQWATPVSHDHIVWNMGGAGLLLMLFLLLFVRFAKEKVCQLALVWVLIGFTPLFWAAFRIHKNGAQIEPHWFVFSSIGFFILAAYLCAALLDRTKKGGVVLLFILIFTWGTVSHAYNQLWADQKTYAFYWSQQVPDLKSTYNFLAYAYQREGSLKESKKYYKMALSGYLSDIDIYNNLGAIDEAEGHFKDAESNYKMVLKIHPNAALSYNNLGSIYLAEGRLEKAKEYFNRSLTINPLLLDPRRGLATIFLKHSDYKKAIDLCLINLDIVHDDTKTLSFLIDIYIQKRDFVNMKKYAHLIIDDETDPEALTKLGVLMAQNNASDLALDCFIKVIRMVPDYKDAYLAAGTLLANGGKYDEAIHLWKIGLSIDPSDQRFQKNIAKAVELKSK